MPYIGKSPLHGNYSKLDDFSGDFDGSDATHALATNGISITPVTEAAVLISINGVLQEPVTDYTVSGTNITFTTAPASGASFFGVALGEQLAGNTPSNSTITSAKLAGTFLTGATDIGAAIADADLFLVDDGAGGTLRKTAASRFKTYITGASGDLTGTWTVSTAMNPDAADGATLGSASAEWSDLYLADSSVIYFGADQDITLTHSADTGLTTNGTFQATTITATTAFVPDASDGAALGTTALEFSALFLADGALVYFGDDQEITLTHVADTGLNLKHAASGDDKYPTLTLQTRDTDIASADKLGVINFQAPDEGAGTDAILVAAGIEAVSEGDFSSSNNATKLSFKTASTDTAAETMSLSSGGNLVVSGTIAGSHGTSIAIGKALAVAMLF